MSRRVNFTSFSDGGDAGIKLPSIHSSHNWVNERPVDNQRFHSEPRQRNERLQYLGPAGAKTSGVAVPQNERRSLYSTDDTRILRREEMDRRRQKSLPARKPAVSERADHIRKSNSASDKEKLQNQPDVRQTVTLYLASPGAKDHELGPETRQVIHGVRTRAFEESYLRSSKFATSWAKVRADNMALRDGSPSEMSPNRASRDGSYDSPRRDGSPDKSTNISGGSRGNLHHSRFVLTKPRGRPPNRRPPAGNKTKKAHQPGVSPGTKQNKSQDRDSSPHSGDSRERDERGQDARSGDAVSFDSERSSQERRQMSQDGEKTGSRRRPAWNSNVRVVNDGAPPPQRSLKRYEKELTFKPAITTKEEVVQAYTINNYSALPPDDGEAFSEDERYWSPSGGEDESGGSRSNSESPAGRSKERMLTRREARAYLKMNAVYGSDAYKQQRRQWFLEKLASAQDRKVKLEEERQRAEEKKREEDRRRQQRQLNYVRDKFRKEQVHRFRTQYVTNRVLEHEYANRHEYGLPEDYDDGTNNNKENQQSSKSKDDQQSVSDTAEDSTAVSPTQTYNNGHETELCDSRLQDVITLQNGKNLKGGEDRKAHNNQSEAEKLKKKVRNDKEEERRRQREEQQKSWYAAYERKPKSDTTKTPLDNRDSNVRSKTLGKVPSKVAGATKTNTRPSVRNVFGKGKNDDGVRRHEAKDRNGEHTTTNNHSKDTMPETDANRYENGRFDDTSNDNVARDKYENYASNRPGAQKDSKLGNSEAVGKNRGARTTKTGHPTNKFTGPSLPHTKSHTVQDKAEERKGNAPVIFTGHFRQEVDGTYHTLDESNQKNAHALAIKDEDTLHSQGDAYTANEGAHNSRSPQTLPLKNVSEDHSQQKLLDKPESDRRGAKSNVKEEVRKNEFANQNGVGSGDKSSAAKPNETSRRLSKDMATRDRNNNHPSSKAPPSSTASKDRNTNQLHSVAPPLTSKDLKPSETKPSVLPPDSQPSVQPPSVGVQSATAPSSSSKTVDKHTPSREMSLPNDRLAPKPPQQQAPEQRQPNSKVKPAAQQATNTSVKPAAKQATSTRQATASSRRSTGTAGWGRRKPQGNAALAQRMFDVNLGPAWDPHRKVPKMEGIDTVVIKTRDGKGQVVKQRKQVKSVVKDAERLLKVPNEGDAVKRTTSKRSNRMASPDVTLGSDFDVDDDEEDEEPIDDMFERLRKKYNIQIDSDEEDAT